MEQRFSIITLGVADLEQSRAFYRRLGWTLSSASNDGITFFQAGGAALALYPRAELAKDANVAPESHGFAGFTIAYNSRTKEEVDAVLAAAQEAGARILKPAHEAFWGGYSGYFADPDNFAWEVAWNPYFSIAEDGSIVLPPPQAT
jgi:catechol 2,3-dioxygenase-like lactoylglutathione lyase family enzyme